MKQVLIPFFFLIIFFYHNVLHMYLLDCEYGARVFPEKAYNEYPQNYRGQVKGLCDGDGHVAK